MYLTPLPKYHREVRAHKIYSLRLNISEAEERVTFNIGSTNHEGRLY